MDNTFYIDLLVLITLLIVAALLGFFIGWIARGTKNKYSIKKPARNQKNKVEFNSALAKATLRKTIVNNDLKIIEGIGPKIEELLIKKGIDTWYILGNTTVNELIEILEEAGERFSLHSPKTWPKQAKLAANNEWIELKEFQSS